MTTKSQHIGRAHHSILEEPGRKERVPRKVPKLQNRPFRLEEARAAAAAHAAAAMELEKSSARAASQAALRQWYSQGYANANVLIPNLQRESNLKQVAEIPGWQKQKGASNGYVMIMNFLHGELRPIRISLTYHGSTGHHTGGLTYRQLHQQIRQTLELEKKVSLRLCPFRPWYGYIQNSCPVPERLALPATDAQCRHLLGTTLLYFPYVHLAYKGSRGASCATADFPYVHSRDAHPVVASL